MSLIRSGSTKSTLSTMQRRATRYEKHITLSSILLLVASTIIIFTSIILIKWYFMPYLYFWHSYFIVAPYMMLSLGLYLFFISTYGFVIAEKKSRGLLVVFSLLLGVGFIGHLVSIFVLWQVRTEIQMGFDDAQILEELEQYGTDPEITKNWDFLQESLSCCGGFSWYRGYRNYRQTPIGRNLSVPDSCCLGGSVSGCGNQVFEDGYENTQKILTTIYTQGCVQLLQKWMTSGVEPIIEVYTASSVGLAVIEIIAIVFASAYVAQITRRLQREEIMWYTVNGRNKECGDEYDSLQRPHINDVSSCNDTEV